MFIYAGRTLQIGMEDRYMIKIITCQGKKISFSTYRFFPENGAQLESSSEGLSSRSGGAKFAHPFKT